MGHRQSKPTYENEQSPVPAPVPEDRCDQLEYELYRSREEVKIINETYQQIKKKNDPITNRKFFITKIFTRDGRKV